MMILRSRSKIPKDSKRLDCLNSDIYHQVFGDSRRLFDESVRILILGELSF